MFAATSFEIGKIQHGHNDGSWHDMEQVEPESSGQDPERGWLRGRIFRCTACEDEIRVQEPAADAGTVEPLA